MIDNEIHFDDIQDLLMEALNSRDMKIDEPVTLMKGFFNPTCRHELHSKDSFIMGGRTLPTIAVIGDESGQVYFFSLKRLLKDKFDVQENRIINDSHSTTI